MAAYLQNKISIDVSADSTSSESLSFAGFLSVQDLQPNPPPSKTTNQIKKHDPKFGLHGTTTISADHSLNKNHPVDSSMSSGQLQLHALLSPLKQTEESWKHGYRHTTSNSSKRSGDDSAGSKPSRKTTNRGRNQRENAGPHSSFGKKIFVSFVSPCRECHAQKPAVRNAHCARK